VEACQELRDLLLHLIEHLILGQLLNVIFLVEVSNFFLFAALTQLNLFSLSEVFLVVAEEKVHAFDAVIKDPLVILMQAVFHILQVI